MTEGAKAKLELIKKIIGAEELVEYCQHVYDSALDIQEAGNVDAFLKMNYIFAIDAGYGRDAAVRLFKEFLVECFELDKAEEDDDFFDDDYIPFDEIGSQVDKDSISFERQKKPADASSHQQALHKHPSLQGGARGGSQLSIA